LAEQQTAIAQQKQRESALRAEEIAAEKTAIAYEKYVASIAPIAEQELQNALLAKRIELMDSGVTGEFLETQMKIFEAEEKTRIAGQLLDKTNKAQAEGYERLKAAMPGYVTSLQAAALAQQNLNFATAKSDLAKRGEMAMALTPDAELRLELARKYPGDLEKQSAEFSQTKTVQKMEKLKQDLQGIASSIGDAFGTAFKDIATGSVTAQQALANFFQSVASSFADMAAKMIAEWVKMQIIGLAQSLLTGGLRGIGGATGGFAGMTVANNAVGEAMTLQMMAFASGGVAAGGFRAFANGGIVTGPTLGLVGEGRFNEAIVPLPNGKSIPVDLGDGAGNNISTNIVINVSNGQAQSSMTGGGASDFGRKMEGAVKQVIVNELRPGGVLAGARR
jgi:hypothetical protein